MGPAAILLAGLPCLLKDMAWKRHSERAMRRSHSWWPARREEVVQLQRTQADRLNDLETRGQARLSRSLPRELTSVLDSLDSTHDEAAQATRSRVETVKASLAETRPSPENETAVHPGLAGGHLIAPSSVGKPSGQRSRSR